MRRATVAAGFAVGPGWGFGLTAAGCTRGSIAVPMAPRTAAPVRDAFVRFVFASARAARRLVFLWPSDFPLSLRHQFDYDLWE